MKKLSEESGEFSIHLDGKFQNLISRKSAPRFQMQPLADVLQCRCFLKLCNIRRKTAALESLFHKFPVLQACNLLKRNSNKGVSHRKCYMKKAVLKDFAIFTTFRNYY